MLRRFLFRFLIGAAIAFGLLLNWSTHQFDLQELLQLDAEGVAQLEAAAYQEIPISSPEPPTVTPVPGSSVTPEVDQTPESTLTPLASATVTGGAPTQTPTISATPPNLPEDLPSPTDKPAEPGTKVEAEITAEGGRLASPDGRVLLEFPAGATNERLLVRITHLDVGALERIDGHPFLTGWQFDAFALDRDLAPVESFESNIRITTNYSFDDLVGRAIETLRLWTWDESESRWQELPSQTVPDSGVAIAEVNHFSIDVGTADPALVNQAFLRAYQTNLQTGASTVSLPIDVPPGEGGLTPNLNLTYSSDRVNEMKPDATTGDFLAQGSWTGIGWDLDVGSIRAVYESHGGSSVNVRLFLELNGAADEIVQDLTLDSTGKTWRARHEEYIRIRQVKDNDSHPCTVLEVGTHDPCHWIVTDKSGTKYYFGGINSDDDSYARWFTAYWTSPAGWHREYYRWDLARIEDSHGNQINLTYTPQQFTDTTSHNSTTANWVFSSYLDDITYNNSKTKIDFKLYDEGSNRKVISNNPAIQVRDDAPKCVGSPDCSTYDVGQQGIRAEETRRLESIEVLSGSTTDEVRKYDFNYVETDFSYVSGTETAGQTKLNWVKQYGSNGSSWTLFAQMDFSYSNKNIRYYTSSSAYDSDTLKTLPFLDSATNGFGGMASYTYTEKNPWDYWSAADWSRQVVTKRALDSPGMSGITSQVSDYIYSMRDGTGPSGPAYLAPAGGDSYQHEFRGFARVIEVRETGLFGTYVEHEFYTRSETSILTDEPRSGRPKASTWWECQDLSLLTGPARVTCTGSPDQWRKVTYDWQTSTVLGSSCTVVDSACEVYLNKLTTDDGTTSSVVNYSYDDYLNQTHEHHEGNSSSNLDDFTIYSPYHVPASSSLVDQNDYSWIFLPQVRNIYGGEYTSGTPNLANLNSGTVFYYDGADDAIFGASPTKGNLTRTERSNGGTPSDGDETPPPTALWSDVYREYYTNGSLKRESFPTAIRSNSAGEAGGIPSGARYTEWQYETVLDVYPISRTVDPTPGLNHVTSFQWDNRTGLLDQRDDPNENEVHFGYDVFGRLTKEYDSLSSDLYPTVTYDYHWDRTSPYVFNSTEVSYRFGTGTQRFWESRCYDGFGRPVQSRRQFDSSDDAVVQISYDRRGLVSSTSEAFKESSNSEGKCDSLASVSANYITSFYNPVDELGIESTVYNQSAPGDTPSNVTVARKFIRSGLQVEIWIQRHSGTDNLVEKRWTDEHGRLSKVQQYTGVTPSSVVTEYLYDASGHLTRVNEDSTATGANAVITRFTYDGLGRKVGSFSPDTGATTFAYDVADHLQQQKDARGKLISWVFDGIGRPIKKCHADALSCAGTSSPTTAYTYDSYTSGVCSGSTGIGHRTSMNDQSGTVVTDYCYDARGNQLKQKRSFDNGTECYLLQRSYDAASRVASVTYPGGTGCQAGESVSTTFDSTNGEPVGLSGTTSYISGATYDAAFRLDSMTLATTSSPQVVDPQYDGRGAVKKLLTGPSGSPTSNQNIVYTYNGAGEVTSINDAADGSAVNFTYDNLSRLTAASGAYAANYSYDALGNLTRINEGDDWYPTYVRVNRPHAPKTATKGSTTRTFAYDASGNLVAYVDSPDDTSSMDTDGDGCRNGEEVGTAINKCSSLRRSRDPFNRWDYFNPTGDGLNKVDDILAVVGHYYHDHVDPGFNSEYSAVFDGDAQPPNGLIRVGDILAAVNSYFEDCTTANGCKPTFSNQFTYDNEGQLTKVALPGQTTDYVYDGDGKLAKKLVAGGATTRYLDDVYESGTKHYWFSGRRVAMRTGGGDLKFFLADALGSSTKILNPNATSAGTQQYYPFGKGRSSSITDTDKRFTGHQLEGTATYSLYYAQSRFYDPTLGRFLQPDSAEPDYGSPQALNMFSYALNSPLMYTDPTGHVCVAVTGGAVCALPNCGCGSESPISIPQEFGCLTGCGGPDTSLAEIYAAGSPLILAAAATPLPGIDEGIAVGVVVIGGTIYYSCYVESYCQDFTEQVLSGGGHILADARSGVGVLGELVVEGATRIPGLGTLFEKSSGEDPDYVPPKEVRPPTAEELRKITHRELGRHKGNRGAIGEDPGIGINKKTGEIVVARPGGGYTKTDEYLDDY